MRYKLQKYGPWHSYKQSSTSHKEDISLHNHKQIYWWLTGIIVMKSQVPTVSHIAFHFTDISWFATNLTVIFLRLLTSCVRESRINVRD